MNLRPKAMVLAAGLGTRLRPLTDDRPKALVEVGGRTMLELTLARLRVFGVQDVIINVHHFAGKITAYLAANNNFGLRIEISREDDLLLDTGGGLKNAAHFFPQDSAPFILHNVDVISTVDLARMIQTHSQNQALATLAVQKRESSRQLLFDDMSRLCGRRTQTKGKESNDEIVRAATHLQPLAFCGIHVVSPRLLGMLKEDGVFSIINSYLRLAAAGEKITAFNADEYYWRDLGKPAEIAQAAEELQREPLRSALRA